MESFEYQQYNTVGVEAYVSKNAVSMMPSEGKKINNCHFSN